MKLISYSLWGNNSKYTIGAIKNANLAEKFYPGWVCRFYCARDVPEEILQQLKQKAEVVICDDKPDWRFTTKRFLPMSETGIDRIIFRDTDSRFTEREVAAVKEWENTGKILHIMKDHPHHGGFPILAGMFGILGDYVVNVDKLLKLAETKIITQYHYDQIFLQNFIWSLFKNDCIIHDEFFVKNPFPIKRIGYEYVGQPFNADDTLCIPNDIEILKRSINE